MISDEIRRYKELISGLNVDELVTVLNKSRLSTDERYVVELIDLYGKSIKEASFETDKDTRQVNRWLHKARAKILKQVLK